MEPINVDFCICFLIQLNIAIYHSYTVKDYVIETQNLTLNSDSVS